MKKRLFLFIWVIMINSLLLSKEVSKTGTTAAGFLSIEVGARAVGMGCAYVTLANDATAMFWNPSGIARINKFEGIFSYTKWIADVNFNYAGVVMPIEGIGSVGLNATFMSMDDMKRTTIDNPDGTGETFSAGSYAFGLSFARNLTDRFSIGFNFKFINESIYHSSANGIAFDVGTIFDTQVNGLTIGMSISNYGSKMKMSGIDMLMQVDIDPTIGGNNENINANLKTDGYDLPLMFRVGVSYDLLRGAGNSNLLLAADATHPNDDMESVNVGTEYMFNKMFALRAGYGSLFSEDVESGISFGAGFQYKAGNAQVAIDYAYRDFGVLTDVQMVSLKISF